MQMPVYTPVWNWRRAKNLNGLYPVHIELYIARKRKYYAIDLPLKIAGHQWSGKNDTWVKSNHPYAFEINNRIKETLDLLSSLNKRYYAVKKTVTFADIFKELKQNNNNASFNQYFETIIKDPPELLDDGTMNRYRAALKKLNLFKPDITFNELPDTLFIQFKKYCEQDVELAASTTNGYFNAVKKVVYWSRKDNHITKEHQESTFENVHIKVGRTRKDSFSVEEIIAWKDYIFLEKYNGHQRDRDMFLLQIFTGGYYNDLRTLQKEDLKYDNEYGYYIYRGRYKNDNLSIVPLYKFPKGLEIIERYKDKDPNSPYLLKREAFIEDQVYNRRLKEIAGPKMLNWKRNVYNKLARNTNAQLYIRYGTKRPVVSRMLGHDKEETTSSYYDVNILEIIEGTKHLDFVKLGIAGLNVNTSNMAGEITCG